MSLNANLIKELREKSGAGIVDCKNALLQNDYDVDKSIDWLRKHGLSVAAKKSGRVAAEGLVGAHIANNEACLIEINSETDFVSRNEQFQKFVSECSKIALTTDGDVETLLKCKFIHGKNSVEEELTKNVATIGENLSIRRIEKIILHGPGLIVSYVHNSVSENLGKIAVLLSLKSNADKKTLENIGKKIAMHIAASNPISLNIDSLDPKIVDKEKQVLIEQAVSSGKPKDIAEKMVEGRIKKFFEEVVLLEQTFVIDGKSKIKDVLKQFSSELGTEISIETFKILILGQGIEVETKDFAAEVAATVNN
ncbi:translation elongation factor Ts [Alphaproteobacteria bacterium]|nr:translation elongation factor Ts [Alphaproteobacteria bacterium]